MKKYTALTSNMNKSMALLALLFIATSCGTYQNKTFYENDGIYASSSNIDRKEEVAQPNSVGESYQSYFRTRRMELEDEVVTDVENYSSVDTTQTNYARQGSWGDNSSDVIVNVYDNSWAWGGAGWGGGWGWNSWYGPGWGWGWGWGGG